MSKDITDLRLGDCVTLSDGNYVLVRMERKRMPTLGVVPNWVFRSTVGKKEQRFTGRVPINVVEVSKGMYVLESSDNRGNK